jgi:solute carrier family 25 protein 39/40
MEPETAGTPELHITSLQQIQSSCTGALITSLLTTPFDVVRVRLQAQQQAALTKACYLMDCRCLDGVTLCYITPEGRTYSPRLNGTIDALMKIAKFEGMTSWWKGLSPTLLMAVPATVIYYTFYDQLKVTLGFKSQQTNFLAPAIAGSISRTVAVACVTPLELLRTKIQSQQHYRYHQLWHVIHASIHNDGLLSLWRGLFPTLLRDVPFSVFYWISYEFLKHEMGSLQHFHNSKLVPLIAGAVSGATAALVTNPLDVVKTHIQVNLGTRRLSLLEVVRDVVSEHGISGLYTGLVPRIAKIAPACAIMISTYESFKIYFTEKNREKTLQ